MNSATLISLGLFILITSLIAGAADLATLDGSTQAALGSSAHARNLDAVFGFKTFHMKEFAAFGLDISLPILNIDFFEGLIAILTWDYSFFGGTFNILRLPLMAISFSFGILFLVTVVPDIATLFRALISAFGSVGGGLTAFARRFFLGA